ncbi:MAG: hypothetical protein II987_03325 [Clostridia bacterium]|nr:hypothetical protein [Clostridia bacterium]
MIAKTNVNIGSLIRNTCILLAVSLLLFGCVHEYSPQESETSKQEESVSGNVSEDISADVSFDLPEEEKPIIEYDLLPEGNEDAKEYSYKITADPCGLPREYEHLTEHVKSANEQGAPYAVCLVRIDNMPKKSVGLDDRGVLYVSSLTVEIISVILASDAFEFSVSDKLLVYDRVNWTVTEEGTEAAYWRNQLPITDESSYYIVELTYDPAYIELLNGCEYEITALTVPINKKTIGDKEQRNAWTELLKLPSDISGLSGLLINKYIDK